LSFRDIAFKLLVICYRWIVALQDEAVLRFTTKDSHRVEGNFICTPVTLILSGCKTLAASHKPQGVEYANDPDTS